MSWKFLEEMLARYDLSANGDLCLKACSKLLSGGVEMLPSWLVDMVVEGKQAAGSLLRLFIANGFLEPAVHLAARILDSQTHQLYELHDDMAAMQQASLRRVQQPSWVSYPVIFNLFDILEGMARHERRAWVWVDCGRWRAH